MVRRTLSIPDAAPLTGPTMTRFLLAAAVAAAVTAAARPRPPAPVRHAVEAKDARRVVGVLTYHVTCPELRAKEWLVYAAAPELPGQTKVKTTLAPAGKAGKESGPPPRPLVVAKVPATTADLQTTIPIRVTYEATLRARTLVELPPDAVAPKVAPLPAAERKLYLAENGDIDFRHETVQKWLRDEGLVRTTEDEVAFARTVLRRLRDRMTYTYAADLDRRASAVCAAGRSDCGGLAVLFVAALRASGVPARALYGRWAASAVPDATLGGAAYLQWHVKAEFFAAGVGWVPADPGGAVQHDRTPGGLTYFGTDPGDFITFHTDPHLALDTGTTGVRPVRNLQTPVWWVTGRGPTTPTRVVEDWKVEAK